MHTLPIPRKNLDALKTNASLKVLHLCFNTIGPRGAEALAEGLRCNKTLQELNLGENKVGDEGATVLADALREQVIDKIGTNWDRYW